MPNLNITKESMEQFQDMYQIIKNKANEILEILSKEDPKNYKNCVDDYIIIEDNFVTLCGHSSYMGCHDWESQDIPMHYFYDSNFLEEVKQRVRSKEEKEREEKEVKLQKLKEEVEKKDREDYERLKKKFEN